MVVMNPVRLPPLTLLEKTCHRFPWEQLLASAVVGAVVGALVGWALTWATFMLSAGSWL